jgi:tRNA-modifying protein YgfZ
MRSILEFVPTAETTGSPGAIPAAGSTAASPEAEYRVLSRAAGLIDRSERGKLALSGPGAVEFLNGQITNELAGLHPGEGRYAAFLTHKGKMLGDLRVLAAGEDERGAPAELLLDTERVALQGLFDMIRRFKVGYEVQLSKRTVESCLFSLVGPETAAVVARAAAEAPELPDTEHAHCPANIAGSPVRLIRTAGPPGVDVLCDAPDGESVAESLRAAGAQPVREAVGEIVRVEHGRPRYGVDLDDSVIPQEAGLNERAVSFTKGCYVGQETVARLHYKGKPNRHLRGLRLVSLPESGEELQLAERTVGRVGSVALSPELGPIALSLVRREAEPGAIVAVGESGASAEVTALPFTAES